ncbi:DUF397 domain-containing protein [Streptomyces sp. NPDC052676]|uniref:DUF397 domain-containing protein n=1 Tax=Streptomyces sp. NPDC052676 TaxID=3154953 RepID=UPI003438C8E1
MSAFGLRYGELRSQALNGVESAAHRTPGGRDTSLEQGSGIVGGLWWFKSSYSRSGAATAWRWPTGLDAVYVRVSKATGNGPILRNARGEWVAFVALAAQ